ncbi:hypothetical protein CEUSTIGMA_g11169.t1 [Chlamydomonas eustigma]|uniref:Methyltransferase type 11 domain-containing protein n=1 Tax=Chlamydomonas eustigma TaxID=1157962 RepID=A0A250XKY9_9CHLO|nr:hypothetical protein CEUSTIGMA_g11169.t1 [Chlamydomonas eustigma]|eukprot:GAX83744.1 hypothetical protein CEUSTIGMA_g11169.t1 [Chlamydomonas eustigma]
MFHTETYWDNRLDEDVKLHTDWLCNYHTILPLIKSAYRRPRATALVLGSGVSTFPEEIYDSGIKEVLMLDSCEPAIMEVQRRNSEGGRLGLYYLVGDPGSVNQPQLSDSAMRFDLVVDKGTIDIILSAEDGWERAARALQWVYQHMRTPATFILISHSPPHDRINLLSSVYWHSIQFKMVRGSSLEDLMSENLHHEELVDYPYAVAEWEEQMEIRAAAQVALDEAAKKVEIEQIADPSSLTPDEQGGQQVDDVDIEDERVENQAEAQIGTLDTSRSVEEEVTGGDMGRYSYVNSSVNQLLARADSDLKDRGCWKKSELPEGRLNFSPGLAFVYILEK